MSDLFPTAPVDPPPTAAEFAAMTAKGRAAWADVPSASDWVEQQRGGAVKPNRFSGMEPFEIVIKDLRVKVAALESEVARLSEIDHRDAKARAIDNRVREVLEAAHLTLSKPIRRRN